MGSRSSVLTTPSIEKEPRIKKRCGLLSLQMDCKYDRKTKSQINKTQVDFAVSAQNGIDVYQICNILL